jgi:hypothetical protein
MVAMPQSVTEWSGSVQSAAKLARALNFVECRRAASARDRAATARYDRNDRAKISDGATAD